MKTIFGFILAAMVGTGCYTQVKSSGDYWGYTGKHEQEKAEVIPNRQDTTMYQDSSTYVDNQRSRDDEGYSYNDTYNDNYYSAPNYDYYTAPYVSFSFGFGWHRPWWNLGYASYYPYWYPTYYDPYWDWYYQPGFSPYGCLAPIYPYYSPFYHSFYHPYYSEHFGYFHHGSFDGGIHSHSGIRTGRIGGGESRGRSGAMSGTGISNTGSSTRPSSVQPRSNGTINSSVGRSSGSGRIGSHSQNLMNGSRNNPRLIPQTARQGGRVTQSYPPRGPGYSSQRNAPRSQSFVAPRSNGGGISGSSSHASGGARNSHSQDGGSRSGGSKGRER